MLWPLPTEGMRPNHEALYSRVCFNSCCSSTVKLSNVEMAFIRCTDCKTREPFGSRKFEKSRVICRAYYCDYELVYIYILHTHTYICMVPLFIIYSMVITIRFFSLGEVGIIIAY